MAEISDYLQGLNEQSVQEESKIVVVRNPAVDKLCKMYEKWIGKCTDDAFTTEEYERGLELFKKNSFTFKELYDFSILLKKYEHQKDFYTIGIFLSAFINTSKENSFELVTEHLQEEVQNSIFGIGYLLDGKNIKITGSVGLCTGKEMRSGKIIISENIGRRIGESSIGGEIHFGGIMVQYIKIPNIERSCRAKVYHKGELIWPK